MSFFGIGPTELLIILLIAVILFGSKKIPEVARSLGQAVREFKKATSSVEEVKEEITETAKETEKQIIGDESLKETIKAINKALKDIKEVKKKK